MQKAFFEHRKSQVIGQSLVQASRGLKPPSVNTQCVLWSKTFFFFLQFWPPSPERPKLVIQTGSERSRNTPDLFLKISELKRLRNTEDRHRAVPSRHRAGPGARGGGGAVPLSNPSMQISDVASANRKPDVP